MSKETEETPKAASRTRKPLILTKKQQGTQRAVRDTSERQNALQKQHTKDYKASHSESESED